MQKAFSVLLTLAVVLGLSLVPIVSVSAADGNATVSLRGNVLGIPTYDLSISSTEGGNVTEPGEGTLPYPAGTVVSLEATADEGYVFDSWSGTDDDTVNPTNVTMDSNKAVTANFAEIPPIVSITVDPSSIDFGDIYQGKCSSIHAINITNTGNVAVDLTASTESDFYNDCLAIDTSDVVGWAVSGLAKDTTHDASLKVCVPDDYLPGPQNGTLVFEVTGVMELFDLTTSISPEGSGSVEPSSGTYSAGTEVSLEATPAPGWQFVSWSGDTDTIADVDAASTTITMNGDYSIVANFELIPPDTYELTMAVSPVGGGTATDVTGASPYAEGAEVSIKAVAEEGYQFVNWTATAGTFDDAAAEDTTFTMPGQAATVTANFELIPPDTYELTMAVSPVGGGTATDVTDDSPYAEGAEVSIKAVAEEGYQFVEWTATAGTFDDAAAEDTTFTMPGQAATVTANFEETVLPLPTWSVGNNWVYDVDYDSGAGVTDAGKMNIEVTDTTGDSYTLFADYVPDANRTDATTGLPLTVLDADVFINKVNMQYLEQHASILASTPFGEIPDVATITWTYTPVPGWSPSVGTTYDFTKHTEDSVGLVDKTDTRQGKILGVEDVTVPAGTFSCLHIVEYDPDAPGTITYEHWFNATEVKSDVKMIDRETYQGEETRVLASYSVA